MLGQIDSGTLFRRTLISKDEAPMTRQIAQWIAVRPFVWQLIGSPPIYVITAYRTTMNIQMTMNMQFVRRPSKILISSLIFLAASILKMFITTKQLKTKVKCLESGLPSPP